jgi:hypothetical protein
MSNLPDVLIALGLVGAFGVLFVALMAFHKATDRADMRRNVGDGGSDFTSFGGDAGSCDGGGCD